MYTESKVCTESSQAVGNGWSRAQDTSDYHPQAPSCHHQHHGKFIRCEIREHGTGANSTQCRESQGSTEEKTLEVEAVDGADDANLGGLTMQKIRPTLIVP